MKPIYDAALLAEDRAFVLKKFGLSEEQFQAILDAPQVKHTAYPSHAFLFETLAVFKNAFRTIATQP